MWLQYRNSLQALHCKITESSACLELMVRTNAGVAQWVARLTLSQWMPVSREFEPRQSSRVFLSKKLLSLLSTFQNNAEFKNGTCILTK